MVLVRDAVAEAETIRSWVDERLRVWAGRLSEIRDSFDALGAAWADRAEPSSIRLLNLNVGRGKGNWPWQGAGTEDGELDEIAEIILDNDADVVTLQEVFGSDVFPVEVFGNESIVSRLRAETGDEWNVHFSTADHKFDNQDLGDFFHLDDAEPFGNAILVREGDLIEDSEMIADETLQEPGDLSAVDLFDVVEEGRSIGGARIELADDSASRPPG